jgi:tRNA pseudouridine13 synthase
MRKRWPTLLDPPDDTGTLRKLPEDFLVEEIPAYPPAGEGSHLFLQVEKRLRTTDEVVRALSRHLRLPAGRIGCAGLKDRAALTRQWLSVPADSQRRLGSFRLEGVAILAAEPHTNKLKTGHLKGNRFRIRIRDLPKSAREEVTRRCAVLSEKGAPNYFGPQRFGRDGQNENAGRELLCGKPGLGDKRRLRLLLSAVQSGLFNDVLAVRLRRGRFEQALLGDVMIKADTGGRFVCEDPEREQPRMDAFEIHPSGPMFGPKMMAARGEPGEIEREILSESGLSATSFSRYPKLTRGARRPLRLVPEGLSARPEGDSLVLGFTLPAGGYATSVLRELIIS